MDDLLTLTEAKEKFRLILAEWQIQQEELVQKAFHFVQAQFLVSYEQLSNHLVSKQPFVLTYVSKVAVIPIGERYLVMAISSHSERADLQRLEQLLRYFMGQREWYLYANCTYIYRFYIALASQLYSKKAALQIVSEVTKKVMKTNRKNLPLKQIHLLYIVYLFSLQSSYVQQEMKVFERRWSRGKWALNEKEQVLLHYLKMHLAAKRKRWRKVKLQAELLLRDDFLASYAVELTVDFGLLMPSYSTDADVFIKPLKNHYVAYACYLYVKALSELNEQKAIVHFLKQEPIASCTMLYTYFRTRNPDDLVRVEAVVQQNIAVLIDGHHSNVRASIQRWQELRQQKSLESNELIVTLSEHLCRLMKACFIAEELPVFEKLMKIYVKYLYIERHFAHLKESIKSNMEFIDLVEMK